ncbi:MAG: GTPase [Gammaproteobacteria bacterium]
MDCDYSDLVRRAKKWGEKAVQSGWISPKDCLPLIEYDARTPDSLFNETGSRPLIVAFLGGTGVGKSTLINRLAGKEIARTGIERPTSREVTLYHHQSVSIKHLPENLPIEQIKLARHDDDRRRNVIWIDMPDIDSTEQKNRQLVLEWLPHIDVLVYVVSPERYRDNKAWRLLLDEGGRHAWLFALNQWDRGQPEQYEDFVRQLAKAGFEDPIIIKTICGGESALDRLDEFNRLDETIEALADEHTIQQLELLGIQARREELREMVEQCLDKLGPEQAHGQLIEEWSGYWKETVDVLQQGFNWPLRQMASAYAEKETSLLDGLRRNKNPEEPKKSVDAVLWDDWAQSRYEDVLDEIVIAADQQQLAVHAVKQSLQPLRNKALKIVDAQTELAVRQALANPGNGLQRFLMKFSGFLATFLPLSAMGWVGYQVYYAYYDSNLTESSYLGVNFVLHSCLLILISWLLPFFMQLKLKPSMEKVALKGLTKGIAAAFGAIEAEVLQALNDNRSDWRQYVDEAKKLIEDCRFAETASSRSENKTLARMLIAREGKNQTRAGAGA